MVAATPAPADAAAKKVKKRAKQVKASDTYTIFGSERPTKPSHSDTAATVLGVKFRSTKDGWVTGIRFYKGAKNTGTHVGTLWSASGKKLASVRFTEETSSGWQSASFAKPVAIEADTTYIASYHAPKGRYAADERYFDEPKVASRLRATGSRFVYGSASSFPSKTYKQTNYYVDVKVTYSLPPLPTPEPTPAPPAPTPDPAPPVPTPEPTPATTPPPPPPGPSAAFRYTPTSPTVNQVVTFTTELSSCSAIPCSYSWRDVGASGNENWPLGTGATLGFTFRNPGTKHVELTITDSLGRTASVVRAVSVAASPAPSPTPTASPTPTPTATASPTPSATPTPTPTPSPSPGSEKCDRNATPSTFASQVSAATAGETICLASGNYGTWQGTNKAITIRPQTGATPTMGIQFNTGDQNFTIDGGRTSFDQSWGLKINSPGGSPDIGGGAKNITIKNTDFSVGITITGVANANILFDHNYHHDLSGYAYTAAIHLNYGSSTPSGVTVQNSLFRELSSDGIQHGPAMNILYNEFDRVLPRAAGGDSSLHTDAIQPYSGCSGGVGSVIKGNYFHEGEQAIGAFDGTCNLTIEDNVIQNYTAHWITVMADRPGSRVRHNTIVGTGARAIACYSKSGAQPSLTSISDNIAGSITLNGSVNCNPTLNTRNMLSSGASGTNFTGTPKFVGGPNPTTYEGFRLAPDSPGKNAASDGLDVGVRFP